MENSSDTKKKCKCKVFCFICKLVAFFAVIAGICAAVLKVLDAVFGKKHAADNLINEYKCFTNYLGSKDISPEDKGITGIFTRNIFAATNIDLTQCEFAPDFFISLSGVCSAVNIIVPDNINVKLDGIYNRCAVHNETEEVEGVPCIYIAAKCNLCAIRISRQE